MANQYIKKSKLTEKQLTELIENFSLDLPASDSAKLLNISRNTVNKYYRRFRGIILDMPSPSKEIVSFIKCRFYHPTGFTDIIVTEDVDGVMNVRETNEKKYIWDRKDWKLKHKNVFIIYQENIEKTKNTVRFCNYYSERIENSRGVKYKKIYGFLKESIFRWNNRNKDIFRLIKNKLKALYTFVFFNYFELFTFQIF